ncbi:VOC family protein [Streptomyces sp. NPDC003717]|uniref:VOC family protein n=1 Tax=Streptomyces sp. NPDC003717 TaxID=3154276 RepID=UPI0033B729BC
MAVQPEGTPCWADAMFKDVEEAKRFYGEVLGWTFGEASTEFGGYTQAFADGKAVAAVVPPMPGQEEESQWCLYFASRDAAATANRIRQAGGEVVLEPMTVGDLGTMCIARDPSGVAFGVWQAGRHEGFEAVAEPGAYCWAEAYTREPGRTDAFFPAVFPSYTTKRMEADGGGDFRVWEVDGGPVLGRMVMTSGDFPAEVAPFVNLYFAVPDCDAAVERATGLGGAVRFGPMDSPFGRFATLADPYGASFTVIDVARTTGEVPKLTDVA